MSNNFPGVTFPYQNVTPADDSVVRRAAFADGILYGCALSYVGTTLTMATGQLMVCGRQIRHVATTSWPIVDKTSGYARIVLTIDLSRAVSEEVFEQISTAIEYADSLEGFPELEQEAIYADGKRYQFVLCVVSLASGGISGIVSQAVITASDSTVLIWEGTFFEHKIYFDTAQFRYYWILATNEVTTTGAKTSLHSSFIVSDAPLRQMIVTFDGHDHAERYISIDEDGLSFDTANAYFKDGTYANADNYAVPIRIYGVR